MAEKMRFNLSKISLWFSFVVVVVVSLYAFDSELVNVFSEKDAYVFCDEGGSHVFALKSVENNINYLRFCRDSPQNIESVEFLQSRLCDWKRNCIIINKSKIYNSDIIFKKRFEYNRIIYNQKYRC